MPPVTVVALIIIVLAVLPGCMYTWAFERQVSGFGVTVTDRVLRFIAVSVLFHLALGWPEYALYRLLARANHLNFGQFATCWVAVLLLVALPALVGTTLGGLYATRNTRQGWNWLRRRLSPSQEDKLIAIALGRAPAPRAWDHVFASRPSTYLRVRTTDNTIVAGLFANQSYAGGFPHDADLLLETAWSVEPDGTLADSPLDYAVYIPASRISVIEIISPRGDEPHDE